jgi:hypothetical protein
MMFLVLTADSGSWASEGSSGAGVADARRSMTSCHDARRISSLEALAANLTAAKTHSSCILSVPAYGATEKSCM